MVKVVKPFSEAGILPRRNGGPLQRVAFNLKQLNYVNVRDPSRAWHVLSGVALLYRHLFTGTEPHQVFLRVLAAYILLRLSAGTGIASYKGSFDMDRYKAVSAVTNPFTAQTLHDVCKTLNLHPIFKDMGDPFAQKCKDFWTFHTRRKNSLQRRRDILLTALFFLSVRSAQAVDFFVSNPDCLLRDFGSFARMWSQLCEATGPYFGLQRDRPHALHTTEQKTVGAGKLLDELLHKLWLNPKPLDAVLQAGTPQKFTDALKRLPRMSGVLGYEHTLDYFILCEQGASHRLFSTRLSKGAVDNAVVGGSNSQVF